jgi:hypothetical protein
MLPTIIEEDRCFITAEGEQYSRNYDTLFTNHLLNANEHDLILPPLVEAGTVYVRPLPSPPAPENRFLSLLRLHLGRNAVPCMTAVCLVGTIGVLVTVLALI